MDNCWIFDKAEWKCDSQHTEIDHYLPVEFANESEEIELDKGLHAIRIERLGDMARSLYRFTIINQGLVDVEGRFVNLAWRLTPFYILASFLNLTTNIVLWWNRHNVFGDSKKVGTIDEQEKITLMKLKKRFNIESNSSDGLDKIRSSLKVLSKESGSQ